MDTILTKTSLGLNSAQIAWVVKDPANADKITRPCKDYLEALHPYSAGGAYSNFMMDEGEGRVSGLLMGVIMNGL